MKKTSLLALLAVAGGTSAFAAVRETITIASAQSDGRIGAAVNSTVTATLAGTWDNSGTPTAYTVRQIIIDGTLTTTYPGETQILITPPSGTPFIFNPRPISGTPFAGRICIPVGAVTTAGTWSFRFYDSYDDAGIDADWSGLSFGFDDAAPATGFLPGSGQNIMLSNVLADGVAAGGYVTTGFTVAAGPTVTTVRISGNATALLTGATTNTTALTAMANFRFVLVAPDGSLSTTVVPTLTATQSSTTFSGTATFTSPVATAGDWTLRSFSTADLPQVLDANTGTPITGSADAGFPDLMVSFLTAPPATTIALTDGGVWNSSTASSAGETKWFTFTTPAGLDLTGALDIDTEGTNLSPVNDDSIGLYTMTGVLVDSDLDSGSGQLGQLSYGSGSRAATGDGLRFRGQSGTTAGTAGNVGAGTQYLLAVSTANGTYGGTAWGAPTGTNSGSVTARVRVWSSGASTDPVAPPVAEDLGTFNSTVASTETVVTATNTITNGSDIKWYKFTIPAIPAGDPTIYLDLDTEGTAEGVTETIGAIQDSELGLYSSTGTRVGDDDDDGNGYRSALSYGSTTVRTAIPNVAPATAGVARDGRDLGLAADTYYASVTTYNSAQNATDFDVVPDTTRAGTVGDRKFNIRTNLTLAPSCVCCNLSNVAGPNQSTTPDDVLTADDIIVFLGWFFANDGRANVAGANQSTIPDNVLTADDIIVFLGRYFQGC